MVPHHMPYKNYSPTKSGGVLFHSEHDKDNVNNQTNKNQRYEGDETGHDVEQIKEDDQQSPFRYYHGWQPLDSSKSNNRLTASPNEEALKYRTDKIMLQSDVEMSIMHSEKRKTFPTTSFEEQHQ